MSETKCYRCDKTSSSYALVGDRYFCEKCYGKIKKKIQKNDQLPKYKCPKCQKQLVPGEAKVHGDLAGFLVAGVSIQHLWFEPYDGSFKENIAIESLQSAQAYFCEDCKFVLIDAKGSRLGRKI